MKTINICCTAGLSVLASFFVQPVVNAQPLLSFTPAELDSIQHQAAKSEFSGSIFILKKDQPLMRFNQGLQNGPSSQPITSTTRFNIGSIGKVFTATLVMQLVEQKHLDLDRPVASYLPASYSIPNADVITIRHLLSQTSGLGDFFESPAYHEKKTRTTDDHLALVQAMQPVGKEPGKVYQYSNSGFIVLGKLLELHYRKPYQQIVNDQLLRPAGVTGKAGQQHATGYRLEGNQWVKGEGNHPDRWSPAGGIFLSANELARVLNYIVYGPILSTPTKQHMWAPAIHPEGEPPFVHYGLGWMVEQPLGLQFIGHNGGVRGFQAAFRYLPQSDLFILVLSNRDNGAEAVFMNMLMTLMQKQNDR
jgi:CubicO group peptidase (beta-lactamase class C family)